MIVPVHGPPTLATDAPPQTGSGARHIHRIGEQLAKCVDNHGGQPQVCWSSMTSAPRQPQPFSSTHPLFEVIPW